MTSGRAGGSKNREPLEADYEWAPPKGGLPSVARSKLPGNVKPWESPGTAGGLPKGYYHFVKISADLPSFLAFLSPHPYKKTLWSKQLTPTIERHSILACILPNIRFIQSRNDHSIQED